MDVTEQLRLTKLALDVALRFHSPNLPGDSRAVPDWFVAAAAISCDLLSNPKELESCLKEALNDDYDEYGKLTVPSYNELVISFTEPFLVCVNATDRCQGSFPCPYCEVK